MKVRRSERIKKNLINDNFFLTNLINNNSENNNFFTLLKSYLKDEIENKIILMKEDFMKDIKTIKGQHLSLNKDVENDDDELGNFTIKQQKPSNFPKLEDVSNCNIFMEWNKYLLNALQNPKLFTQLKIKPKTNFMFYGPPGSGKTFFVQAIINQLEFCYYELRAQDIFSKWQGNTEKRIARIFEEAMLNSPCALFIDEVDFLLIENPQHNSIRCTFLSLMNNLKEFIQNNPEKLILVFGTTNKFDLLDEASKRRFDEKIYMGLPDKKGIIEFLYTLNNVKNVDGAFVRKANLNIEECERLATMCEGYSNFELSVMIENCLLRKIDGKNIDITKIKASDISLYFHDIYNFLNKNL